MMRLRFYNPFLILFIILSPRQTSAQNSTETASYLPKKAMQEDLNFWVQNLKDYHPGLFWHVSETEFNRTVDSLYSHLPDSLTEHGFLRHIGSLTNLIQCAHSSIGLSEKSMNYWEHEVVYPPFNLQKIGGKYYINEHFDTSGILVRGMEILSINGVPVHDLVQGLLPYIQADGRNISRKYYALGKGFYYYAKLYGPTIHDQVQITTVDSLGNERNLTMSCINRLQIQLIRQKNEEGKAKSPLSFTWITDSSVAYLKVHRFYELGMAGQQGLPNFHHSLDSFFTLMSEKKTQGLIIDLRGNPGGYSEFGAQLNAFLAHEPFYYCRTMWLTSDSFPPYLHLDSPSTFIGFPEGIVKDSTGYVWKSHSVLPLRQPEDLAFQGKVCFLIDGGCASTCTEMVSVAYENKQGIFIGEEVGGSYQGDNSGVLAHFTLPNSRLQIRIPLVRYELAVSDRFEGHGVIPDYAVDEDPLFQHDPVLGKAVELLE